MWSYAGVVKLLKHTNRYIRLLDATKNHKFRFQFGTTTTAAPSKIVKIPIEIKYPSGDKRLQTYLQRLREQYDSDDGNRSDQTIVSRIVQNYENRISLVEQYTELTVEMEKDSEQEFLSIANEEKEKFSQTLAEIDEDMVNDVVLLNDEKHDYGSVMLEVSAGVGGQEAMLFARELFEMYENYTKYKNWDHNVLEENIAAQGGIRNGAIVIRDVNAYDLLKFEAGVHRVQRVPKTEKSGRIHTSTAAVTVIPCANDIDIKLNANDLRIETKRASGPGGQNVNKLETAIRIVHIPTGIAVECQEERTQTQNKAIAMRKLYGRLYHIEFEKQALSGRTLRKSQVGSKMRPEKLRTYNYPEHRITDHRLVGSERTLYNLKEFLAGKQPLDILIANVRKMHQRQKLDEILDSLN